MGTSNEKRGSVGNRPMEGSPRQLPKDGELEMIRERQRARSRMLVPTPPAGAIAFEPVESGSFCSVPSRSAYGDA